MYTLPSSQNMFIQANGFAKKRISEPPRLEYPGNNNINTETNIKYVNLKRESELRELFFSRKLRYYITLWTAMLS